MAVAASAVFCIKPTGDDNNGAFFDPGVASPGTDYSLQNAAQITYTDLVIDAANAAKITSAAFPFTSAHVGNGLHITGGSGFNQAWYTIIAVVGNVATLDRNVGTLNSTGGAGKLGGCLATPGGMGQVILVNVSQLTAQYTVNVQVGTYLMTNTPNIPGGRLALSTAGHWIGFTTVPGDITTLWGAMPSFKANAAGVVCIIASVNDYSLTNIECDGNNGSFAASGTFNLSNGRCRIYNCRAKNCGSGITGAFTSLGAASLEYCECVSAVGIGFYWGGSAFGCFSRSNGGSGFMFAGPGSVATNCAAFGNTGPGFTSSSIVNCQNCASVNNTGDGYTLDVALSRVTSSIAYGNGGYQFGTTAAAPTVIINNCASDASGLGRYNGTQIPVANRVGGISLTADPFTNKAGFDFSLNNTAGGGALLRSLGFGNFPGSATVGFPDVGCARHQDPASAGILVSPGLGGF